MKSKARPEYPLRYTVNIAAVGTVADETSPAFLNDGLNHELSLAEIVDIEMLLGENNRFSATVRFDLDDDASTAEIELFSTELIAKSEIVDWDLEALPPESRTLT